jgi:lycopene cyclase domain-containing protein
MRASYILLNALFTALPIGSILVRRKTIAFRNLLYTAGILCILTAIFDNIMIACGIMVYDPAHISGLKIGLAPIEDFAYALTAGMWVALLWNRSSKE